MLDGIVVATGRNLRQYKTDCSHHFSGVSPPDDSVARELIVLVIFNAVLTSQKSALHAINLISESE